MEQILADTKKAVAEMNKVVSPGEQTRDFYRKQGVEAEQERIIKLLETECCELTDCRCEMRIKWTIALIKGDK